MTPKRAGALTGAALAVGALGLVAATGGDVIPTDTTTVAVVADTVAPGQYQGVCAVVTPPEPDPCDSVNGTLRFAALGAFERSVYHAKWVASSPGDVGRLSAIMASPACSTPSNPQPQIMRTQYGAALAAVMQAIACARHPEPITWPPLPPPPTAGSTDKTAPTAPGPLTVTP